MCRQHDQKPLDDHIHNPLSENDKSKNTTTHNIWPGLENFHVFFKIRGKWNNSVAEFVKVEYEKSEGIYIIGDQDCKESI